MKKKAIIIGAGPAGLTAAFEFLKNTDIIPIIFEQTTDIGGISKTVNYKNNRIDIGGHRFFSKSQKVLDWWLNILPCQSEQQSEDLTDDNIMLIRSRLSRIMFLRKFFDYPISLSVNTIKNLGLWRITKIGFSYIKATIIKRKEKSLEDFFINRFGYELYSTFFKDYTQKVWGVPCSEIKPEWGAQRIKGLSILKTIINAISKPLKIKQAEQETSLIEEFMYPKLGPGSIWEKTADIITQKGGEIFLNEKVTGISTKGNKIMAITTRNTLTGEEKEHNADYFISTMPIKELIEAIDKNNANSIKPNVKEVAAGLKYRDFITVGLLLKEFSPSNKDIKDNWIYIQEKDVKLGRIQIFNNWSPYLVADPKTIWVGLEYFCNEGDELWTMSQEELTELAIDELAKIGLIEKENTLDSVVIKMPKAYPAYFGTYDDFDIIKNYIDNYENLFLIGRNGMHRYNNMDHSMLTAMQAVKNISNGIRTKTNIWQVNAEEDYHEAK